MANTDNAVDDDRGGEQFAGRFVILSHDHPFVHWDLMLEAEGVLRTWRLLAEPAPDRIIAAEVLPDHRPHYLDYEGPVGGDRGTVSRWDHGRHETRQSPQQTIVTIDGQRLGRGRIILAPAEASEWTLVFHRDGRFQARMTRHRYDSSPD